MVFEKIENFLVRCSSLKGEAICSRPILEVLQELSFSCIHRLKYIPTIIERQVPDNSAYDNNSLVLKPFSTKYKNVKFSTIHDLSRVKNRFLGAEQISTEKPAQIVTKWRRAGDLVLISLKFRNSYHSRLREANISEILDLKVQILGPPFCFAAGRRTFHFMFM